MDEQDFREICLPCAFIPVIILETKIKPLISSSALNSQAYWLHNGHEKKKKKPVHFQSPL